MLSTYNYYFKRRDASGMTLEMEAIDTSLVKLAPSGWIPSVAYDKEADEELMEEDKVEAAKREQRQKKSGFFSCKFRSVSCRFVGVFVQ